MNLTTILGTVFHVLGLAALFATHSLTMVTLCLLTGCTELLVLAIRVVIIWKNRRLLRQEEGSPMNVLQKVTRNVLWKVLSFLPKNPKKARVPELLRPGGTPTAPRPLPGSCWPGGGRSAGR